MRISKREAGNRRLVRLARFADMSPAEIEAWFLSNVTSLGEARDVMIEMATILSGLVARERDRMTAER